MNKDVYFMTELMIINLHFAQALYFSQDFTQSKKWNLRVEFHQVHGLRISSRLRCEGWNVAQW